MAFKDFNAKNLFPSLITVENVGDLVFGVVHPVTRDVFLRVAEWNVTREQYEAQYRPTDANQIITGQHLKSTFDFGTFIGDTQGFNQVSYLQVLIDAMTADGYKFFDVCTTNANGTLTYAVSFVKEDDWVNQHIGRINFHKCDRVWQQYDSNEIKVDDRAFKVIDFNPQGDVQTIRYINPKTLITLEMSEINYEANYPVDRTRPVLKSMFNMTEIYVINTEINDAYVVDTLYGSIGNRFASIRSYRNAYDNQELLVT